MEPGDHGLRADPPRFLVVGRVARAHGVRGEVAVQVLTDFPAERFAPGSPLFLGPDGDPSPRAARVQTVRPHHHRLLVRFDAARDRDEAETLTGLYVYGAAADAPALAPDTYYVHQLVGCQVTTVAGQAVGRVSDVLETGAADVLYVTPPGGGREILLPLIGDVVRQVDVDAARIVITPMPGLLD